MSFSTIPDEIKKLVVNAQQNEITEHYVYIKLAEVVRKNNEKNAEILEAIAGWE